MDRGKKHELRRESLDRVRGEIARERAQALGRITRVLEAKLSRLERLHEELRSARGATRARVRATYEAARRDAIRHRWYLLVQREVNGLYDERSILARYPVPAADADDSESGGAMV